MMRRLVPLFAALAFSACSDPVGPEPIASQWALNAWAGDDYGHGCRITGDVGVEGTVADFSGVAHLALTVTDNGTAMDMGLVGIPVRGSAGAIDVGSFRFTVKEREPRLFVGTWECDGLKGVWYMGPPTQPKH